MLIQENLYQWGKINMDKLIAKEVEFNGDILKAAQDPDGNIWVGARWVCEAIGLDDNRLNMKEEKCRRIQ